MRFLGLTEDTPQSVGLLWISDKPEAEISSYNKQHLQETNIHVLGEIRTRNNKRATVDPRLRPRGHLDGLCNFMYIYIYIYIYLNI
jgi:hypothetical protein